MKQFIELESVSVFESALQQLFGNLKADEIMILLGDVTFLGDLHHIKTELSFQVGCGILFVGNSWTEFPAQVWILDGDPGIDRGMSPDISGVMAQRAHGEGVFVDVACVT